jgi:hypothetical protein
LAALVSLLTLPPTVFTFHIEEKLKRKHEKDAAAVKNRFSMRVEWP